MGRTLLVAIGIVGAVLVTSVLTLSVLRSRGSAAVPGAVSSASIGSDDPGAADPNFEDIVIPPFSFVNQDGEGVTQEALKGRVTIINFIFTNCPLICPEMTGVTAGLVDQLKGTPVQIMSISVDPDHDTPERLKEFAQTFGADLTRWQFLRGEKRAVWDMLRSGLKFAIKEDASVPVTLSDGTSMANIVHPSKLLLVGPEGNVLAMYYFRDEEAIRALGARARALATRLRGATAQTARP
ncbi:MAG: SCO family protein [Phycisphaeraceae bacterium]|nr:SCO family protein [Phycisphaeraceae bacterium]